MENIQSRRLRLAPLARALAGLVVCITAALPVRAAALPNKPLAITSVRGGKAVLTQSQRVTTLTYTPSAGNAEKIPLTHIGEYPQGLNAPVEAKLVAESEGKFLIFIDGFQSNPGNVQGECGASPTGERYLHVVSLTQSKETFSTLVESCFGDAELAAKNPKWDPATQTLHISFTHYKDHRLHSTYKVASDGSVQEAP